MDTHADEFLIPLHKQSTELQTEYGTLGNVRFLNPDNVKIYDGEGKEVCIPKCDKCGYYKSEIISSTHHTWLCTCCGGQ